MHFVTKPALVFALGLALAATPAIADVGPGQVVSETPTEIVFNGWNAEYCEIFLISGAPPDLSATFYNTLGLNDSAANDSCPAGTWATLDPKAIAVQYQVEAVFKDGPHAWVVDRLFVFRRNGMFGESLDFGGINARFSGVVQLPPGTIHRAPGSGGYTPTTVNRETRYVYFKGHPIFVLVDPDGTLWIMQAYSRMVDPTLSLATLPNLGSKLTLPPGWKYRVVALNKNLTVHPANGAARIVQDNLEDTYDQCLADTCSWMP